MKTSRTIQTIIPVFIVVIAFLTFVAKVDAAMDLNRYKWKNRLLFIFAPHDSHPLLIHLKNEASARNQEIVDRDLLIFEILENGSSLVDSTRLENQMVRNIRQKFLVSSGQFTVVLVGKDGGVKLRRDGQVKLDEIFSLIDAMPMRREEMRQKGQ